MRNGENASEIVITYKRESKVKNSRIYRTVALALEKMVIRGVDNFHEQCLTPSGQTFGRPLDSFKIAEL